MGLSSVAWSLAIMRVRCPELMAAIVVRAEQMLSGFEMQHLVQIQWSLTVLGFQALVDRMHPAVMHQVKCKVSDIRSQHVHALLWSLWKGSYVDDVWSICADITHLVT